MAVKAVDHSEKMTNPDDPQQTPRGRRALYTVVTFCVVVVVLTLTMETVARLLDPRHGFTAWHERSISYTLDDDVDWVAEPRQYDWTTINQFHFRGPEITRKKPDGVFRVAALGGSSTFEIGKADDETWPAQLQALLAGGAAGEVHVLQHQLKVGVVEPRQRVQLEGLQDHQPYKFA